jgi:2-dehydro-3-deoxyphosphooctonate aldolase (KDO 8-P synthase)
LKLKTNTVNFGKSKLGGENPFTFIIGPCVMESFELVEELAQTLTGLRSSYDAQFVLKCAYDKANRTSIDSFRGPGIETGLKWISDIKKKYEIETVIDVHEESDVEAVGAVADIIQIPAFLCRQTDLVIAAAKSGRAVNIKQGQFLAPWNMEQLVKKVVAAGNSNVFITERGTSFGYNNLIVDFAGFPVMRASGTPLVFDATHSLQTPGGLGNASGGRGTELVPAMCRAAAAAGIDGLFLEAHPSPEKALSDAATTISIKELPKIVSDVLEINKCRARLETE